jgi:hypothetical protein
MDINHPATEITDIKIALFVSLYSLSKDLEFVFLRCKSANTNQVKSAILELSDKDMFKSTGFIAKRINEWNSQAHATSKTGVNITAFKYVTSKMFDTSGTENKRIRRNTLRTISRPSTTSI